jgi:membrane fusion protein, copper/silver efflux system
MKKLFFAFIFSLSLVSTNLLAQHEDHSAHDKAATQKDKSQANPAFQKQLSTVFKAYTNLKNAFVSSDAREVKKSVQPLKDALAKADMKLLKGDAHTMWMDNLKTFNNHLDMIAKAENIDEQRKHFAPLSESMHHSFKSLGLSGREAYYQYCPMANNNKGAYWLSESKEIKNPYFGDKMLKCGSTKEVLN